MHPGFAHWFAGHGRADAFCSGGGHFRPRGFGPGGPPGHGGDDEFGGGAFGVRRPLRFLAWKLELEEPQVAELAKILDNLKTERAQAAVDQRRSTSGLADAIQANAFDEERARQALDLRVKSAEQLRGAVLTALARIHAVLDGEQRERLAYLIRTGALTI